MGFSTLWFHSVRALCMMGLTSAAITRMTTSTGDGWSTTRSWSASPRLGHTWMWMASPSSSSSSSKLEPPERSNNDAGRFLVDAGTALQEQAGAPKKNALLQEAGESLCEIGEAWESNWEAVAYSADDAARCFIILAQAAETKNGKGQRNKLPHAYSGVGAELRQLSCAPAPYVDNLAGLAYRLEESAVATAPTLRPAFRQAAKSVQKLAQVYGAPPRWKFWMTKKGNLRP